MWIARDEDGVLCLFNALPIRKWDYFSNQPGYDSIKLNPDMFPEVTFENSPKKVELKLVEEKQ